MSRSVADRVADVRRIVSGARSVYENRARLVAEIAGATGLTGAGVELGFASLECEPTDRDLDALVAAAGTARHVHVILSANVFVAPLRAIALARAAAPRVTVYPSPRDPVLAREIVAAAGDVAVSLSSSRDVASVEADAIDVYGRDETIAAVRGRARPGVTVRGHRPGMGIAVVTNAADLVAAAGALVPAIVAFDQRGCLSPRLAVVVGDGARARLFAQALHSALGVWEARVPRGTLSNEELADAPRWRATMAFAGTLYAGESHAVALTPQGSHATPGPAGRHVHVLSEPTLEAVALRLSTIAAYVVAVGTDDLAPIAHIAPSHARISALDLMQRPPLDGPVDRRPGAFPGPV